MALRQLVWVLVGSLLALAVLGQVSPQRLGRLMGPGTAGTGGAETPPDSFVSDHIVWPESGITLGTVPGEYENYTVVRFPAFMLVSDESFSITLSQVATCVYGHPTMNGTDGPRPNWLDETWTDTGLEGEFHPPDRDGADRDVPVYYYSKSLASGANAFAGWKPDTWSDRGKYFVGWFLCPEDTVTSESSNMGSFTDDIDSAYVQTSSDRWFWAFPLEAAAACTATATSLAQLETNVEAAAAGTVQCLQAGTYTDDGRFTITSTNGTNADPIRVNFQGSTLAGDTAFNVSNSDNVHLLNGKITATTDPDFGDLEPPRVGGSNCTRCIIDNWLATDAKPGSTSNEILFVWADDSPLSRITRVTVEGNNGQQTAIGARQDAAYPDAMVRLDHNQCIDIVEIPDDNDCVQSGHNSVADGFGGALVDHNYETGRTTDADAEGFGNKVSGGVFWANGMAANESQLVSVRQGGDMLIVRNVFDATGTTSARSVLIYKGNSDNSEQELTSMGNYVIAPQANNGFIDLPYTSDADEYPADDVVLIGDIAYNGNDAIYRISGTNSVPVTSWHFQAVIAWTSDVMFEDTTAMPSGWSIGGSCRDTTSGTHGLPSLPSGLTEENVTWADRGDGMVMPTCTALSYGASPNSYEHIPYELEDLTAIEQNAGCTITGCP